MSKTKLHDILKIKLADIIRGNYNIEVGTEMLELYKIRQQNSPLFEQITLVRGYEAKYIREIIFVESKNKSKNDELSKTIREGFICNGTKYVRFGKSASMAKNGITAFIDDNFYAELFERSQLGVHIDKCVISKYEAYRNLIFSSCTMVDAKIPKIIIVGDFDTIIPNQYVRYVEESKGKFTDKVTGEPKTYPKRDVKEGYMDVPLSPFDGMGIHTKEVSELWGSSLGLDYNPISYQIRIPFTKGMSTEAPIKEFYRDKGITHIKDIFGAMHDVESIECIWSKSMWKCYGIFKENFGNDAFNEYMRRLDKYGFKLGISKYNHRTSTINIKTRMNFQYMQCFDFLNPKYVDYFNDRTPKKEPFDFGGIDSEGKIVKIAKYSTDLYKKIILGDKLYTLKFLGINDVVLKEVNSKYIEAILINDAMLKDICVKKYMKRMLENSISQMKYGKVFTSGFYHVAVGDIIAFLEYSGGMEVNGCLEANEMYCTGVAEGKAVSMRSPLVDPSEISPITIVKNELINKYFKYFEDTDVIMVGTKDITMPRQGGMDLDGDIIDINNEPVMINSVIPKPPIIDTTDKQTSCDVPYDLEHIIIYECNTRDNRIGEITNIATSIINKVTTNDKYKKMNEDNTSLLRIFQGKEIDFVKTGYRWQIPKSMKKHHGTIPYFLLHSYPKKLEIYEKIAKINKDVVDKEDRVDSNAYHSASAMNELCKYIETWEKKEVAWDKSCINSKDLLMNQDIECNNKHIEKEVAMLYKRFTEEFSEILRGIDEVKEGSKDSKVDIVENEKRLDILFDTYREKLKAIDITEDVLANYCVKICYRNVNSDKIFCWSMVGDKMIENLKKNSPNQVQQRIVEVPSDDTDGKDYLGRFYKLQNVESTL